MRAPFPLGANSIWLASYNPFEWTHLVGWPSFVWEIWRSPNAIMSTGDAKRKDAGLTGLAQLVGDSSRHYYESGLPADSFVCCLFACRCCCCCRMGRPVEAVVAQPLRSYTKLQRRAFVVAADFVVVSESVRGAGQPLGSCRVSEYSRVSSWPVPEALSEVATAAPPFLGSQTKWRKSTTTTTTTEITTTTTANTTTKALGFYV